jgi:hypothetical protein
MTLFLGSSKGRERERWRVITNVEAKFLRIIRDDMCHAEEEGKRDSWIGTRQMPIIDSMEWNDVRGLSAR